MAPLLQTTRWHGMRMGICKRARWPHQPGPTPTPVAPHPQPRTGATSAWPHAYPGGPPSHVQAPRSPQRPPTPSHVQAPCQPDPTPTLVAPQPHVGAMSAWSHAHPHAGPVSARVAPWPLSVLGGLGQAQGKCGASSRARVSSPQTHPDLWSVRNQAPPRGERQVKPKPTPMLSRVCGKTCFLRNWFLVPKRLGSRESLHARIWKEKTISLDK